MSSQSWQSIRDAVLARIQSGDWPPGSAIPNEADLAAEFSCARTTVNRALRDLASEGLLERRRKAGTRVAEFPTRRARLHIPLIREEIAASGAEPSYRLLTQQLESPPARIADRMPGAPDRLLRVDALHLADDAPFAFEHRWINPAALAGLPAPDFDSVSANEWLVKHAPFTTGELHFSAEPAMDDAAIHLACLTGTPLFTVERSTRTPAHPVTFVRLSYAPGYRMQMDL